MSKDNMSAYLEDQHLSKPFRQTSDDCFKASFHEKQLRNTSALKISSGFGKKLDNASPAQKTANKNVGKLIEK